MADSNSTISHRTGVQGTSGNGITGVREALEHRKEARFRESLKRPLGTRIHIYMILLQENMKWNLIQQFLT